MSPWPQNTERLFGKVSMRPSAGDLKDDSDDNDDGGLLRVGS